MTYCLTKVNFILCSFGLCFLHLLGSVLSPFINRVFTIGAFCRKIVESLLKSESDHSNINVVGEFLAHQHEEIGEHQRTFNVNWVGSVAWKDHYDLEQSYDECEPRQSREPDPVVLKACNEQEWHMDSEVEVVLHAIWCSEAIHAGVLPDVILRIPNLPDETCCMPQTVSTHECNRHSPAFPVHCPLTNHSNYYYITQSPSNDH